METTQAREHLQWVNGIVRVAERDLNLHPAMLIAWGLFGTLVNATHQARASGLAVPDDATFHLPLMLLALAVTVWAGHASEKRAGRVTLVDSFAGSVFGVVFGVLLIVNLTAQHSVVPARAMGLFWAAGLSIALLIIGLHASRLLLGGGIALLAACVAASFFPTWFDGIFALGWVFGFVVPGLILATSRSNGRAAAL
jgi:hypothetical protein